MRKIASLLTVLMLLCTLAFGQNRTISGKVTDEKGDVLPGASVRLKGTRTGVAADNSGQFRISAKTGDILVVSGAGLETTEAAVGTENTITVIAKRNVTTGTEVVVTTAFGIKRSQRITPYSSQVIGDQQLHIIPQTNINSALAGKVAGVQFRGQSPMKLDAQGSLRIRGGLSLTGDVAPVYVIDGSITGSFDINPDDVQDVTVLKGANATTIFGDIAKGGAIVITTKKAAPGRTNIDINQGVTFDEVYILPLYQNKYSGGAASDLIKFTWKPGMPDEWKPLDGKFYPDYTDDASWGPRMVGQEYVPWYSWIPGHSESSTTARLVAQPDNSRDFYRAGITTNTNVAFSKASQGSNIRVSYTNNSIKGMLPNSSSNRNTLFTTFSYDFSSHFTVTSNITYTSSIIKGQFVDAYANQSSGSFNSWFHRDLDMNKLKQYRSLKTPIGTYASWNLGANPSSGNVNSVYKGNYWYNFYTYFDVIDNKQSRDNLVGNVSLTYKLNDRFKIMGSVRKNSNTNLYEFITPTELETSATQTGVKAGLSTGQLRTNDWSYDVVASYNKAFLNNKLNVNLNAGATDVRHKYNTTEMATKNGLNVPGLYAISNSKDQPTLINTRDKTEIRAGFVFGDVEWNKMVDVSFALRNDWYSVLLPTNNRLLSPSVGVSFFFTDLTKDALPWLSYGKLYGSWGQKPTSGLNPYQTNFTYTINQNKWGTNFLTTTPNTTIDPAIQGALIKTQEIGIDLKFKNNRYGLSVLYYNETSQDAPFNVPISGYSGFNTFLTNISLIKRTGYEVVLDARVMTKKDFSWELTKTFSYIVKNPVIETDTAGNRVQVSTGAAFQGIVPPKVYQMKGKSWGQLVGTAIKRNVDGLYVINPATGAFVTEANHDFGTVVPKVTGGLVNTLTYKNFVLNFSIDYQVGGKFFSLSEMWGTYSGLLAPTAATNDKGWNVRDDVSIGGGVHIVGVSSVDEKTAVDMYVNAQDYFHNLGGSNAIADYFVHSLTFVKLREIALGYNLPISKWNLRWVKGINATVVARNPLLIYRESRNFDPSEISGVYGEDGQFPGTRGIGFNLKFNF